MKARQASNARRRRLGSRAALVALLLLLLGADAYAIYKAHVERLGNALDFYPFWAGGQAVLWQQRNPYDPEITRQTQEAIYGQPALPEENQHAYAYPAYAPFVVWPFLLLPFSASASLWIACQQALVVAAVALTMGAIGWRPSLWYSVALCLAAMTFRYSMITFVLGQTSIWVLFCLAASLWAVRKQRDVWAGLALAAGALKPQLVILPALALLISLPAPRRKRAGLALVAAMCVLLACSWVLAGNWMDDYWRQLGAYQAYSDTDFPVTALIATWLPRPVGQILNGVVVALLLGGLGLVLWRQPGTGRVAMPVALAALITQLALPQTGSYNLALLLLPAILILRCLDLTRGRRPWLVRAGQALVWVDLVLIPWLLWPIVQKGTWNAVDEILVPGLLLGGLGVLVLVDGKMAQRGCW